MLADVICSWKMTSFIVLDGVTSFLHMRGVTNTCKPMQSSLSIGRSYSVQWRKVERSQELKCVFVIYCVLEFKQIISSA